MSDNKEQLGNMLDNLINDKSEQAQIDFHDYLRSKMQDVINPAADVETEETEITNEE